MIPSLCIADRVPASECPCPQCVAIITMARRMGDSIRRQLARVLLESLVPEEVDWARKHAFRGKEVE